MPNLIGAYSPLTRDPVLSVRPFAQPGIYSQGGALAAPCDWFDPTTGVAFSTAQAGPDWNAAAGGADWKDEQTGSGWSSPSGGGWFDDKDCG